MYTKKFAITRTAGNEETLLKVFPVEEKQAALAWGEAQDRREGVIACVLADVTEDGRMVQNTCRVYEVWASPRGEGKQQK